MNREMSASEIRMAREQGCAAYHMLRDHPEMQAEKIARHYLSLAQLSASLNRLIGLRREAYCAGMDTANTDAMIDSLTNEIKEAHFYAFGIPLQWI